MTHVLALIERGRREGAFRTDLPPDWLAAMYFTLVHGADGYARGRRVKRERALELLVATVRDVFSPPARRRA